MPQIIMLNHGAWVNSERCKKRSSKPKEEEQTYKGKKVSELDTEGFKAYINDWE